ncbi:MAG: ComEC/Rec2 family competence protein [Clostridia bacterium]|nr:ComEC/Rec2 family competence protein [Clostridia bacterium]
MFDSTREQDVRNLKPINFRPILFCALSLFSGIMLYRYHPVLGIWTALMPILVIGLICLLFYLIVDKNKRTIVLTTSICCCFFVFVGMLSLGLKVNSLLKHNVNDGYYTVVGEVKDVTYKHGGYYATLTNCTYNGKEGSDLITGFLYEEISLYDVVELKCFVKSASVEKGKKISNQIISGWPTSTSEVYSCKVIGKTDGVASWFKTKTDVKFKSVLGEDFGILSALLRGDVSEMKQTVTTFRVAGIAHIFAVSGLHIGLIFTALGFILGKFKINRVLKVAMTTSALVFYSYLCGFSPSSLRAVIMCTCMMISKLLGQKHDGLNALSISAIIVLLINATDLYSVGFILSFTICLSILILSPPIKSVLSFMPEEFSSSLSVLFASQVSALPLSIMMFNGFSLVSFFANFLLLPVVSIVYYATVIGTVFCVILPINEHIALFIPQVLTVGIKGITEFISLFPISLNYMSKPLMGVYYLLLFGISDFINIPKKVKFSCGVILIVVLLFIAVRSFFGVPI